MSTSFRRSRTLAVALLLLALLVLLLPAAGAFAEGAPYKEVPGYPKYGCYDVIVGGNGMWGGNTPYQITVDVPGPVVDAYLQWVGTEDAGSPNSPSASVLKVNGGDITGQLTDQYQAGPSDPPWYMWRADVGPSGANLVQQGVNKFTVSDWSLIGPVGSRRNGVSVVVVYATGGCAKPNQINLIDNFDWYWERNGGTTSVMTFTFPPSPNDRDVTIRLHHAGSTQQGQQQQPAEAGVEVYPDVVVPSACRGMNLWALAGAGAPPPTLVEYSNTPPTSAFGGKKVITNPFVGSNCGNPTVEWPATNLVGWVDGAGWTNGAPGYIAPELSIIRFNYRIRAGDTFLALQLESEKTGSPDVMLTGESGAWFAQAVIPLEDIKLRIAKTDNLTTAKPGDTLTYVIDYENYGLTPAGQTTIVDTLPAGVAFVSASNGGTLSGDGKTVSWNVGTVAPGAKGQVTLTVKADPIFPAGKTTLTNTVVISTPGEADTSDNTATDTTDIIAQALLDVEKTGAPEPVAPGENLTYTVNWTVGGDAFSEDVKLVDKLPANVTFVSAGDGGVHDAGTGTITWTLGNITPTKNGSVSFVVKVNAGEKDGATITNVATLTNKAGDKDEDSFVNTVKTPVLPPDLAVTKKNTPATEVKPSDMITYEVCMSNSGEGDAVNATMTDVIPVNTTYVPGSVTGGGTYNEATKTLTWKKNPLAPAGKHCGTFKVKVNTVITGLSGQKNVAMKFNEWNAVTIDNMVTATADGIPAKNASVSNPLVASVNPQIYKSANKSQAYVGEEIIFTLTVRNDGTAAATNVVVTDQIPPKLDAVTATTTKGTAVFDPNTRLLTVAVGQMDPAEEVTITIKGKAAAADQYPYTMTNEGVVSFTEGAPRTSNRVSVTVNYEPPIGIPEPGTWLLLGTGVAGLAGYARMRAQARRRK